MSYSFRVALTVFVSTAACLLVACRPATAPAQATNLLLITVDTLRPDRLGYEGHSRDTSSAIDELAATGVRFRTSYSQSGWTLPSMATILTGRYPNGHGAVDVQYSLREEVSTLAEILRERGFQTHGFVSHVFLSERSGLARGFSTYDDSVLAVGDPHKVTTARPLTEAALAVMNEIQEPFFVWVHYFDPHFFYRTHQRWRSFGKGYIDRYDGEIAYTDGQIGRLLEALQSDGLDERTMVVFTADHGEEFGEHGGKYHFGLHEEDVRVPLVIRLPGVEPRDEMAVSQQIDLMPTMLSGLGIEVPEGLPGRDLLAPGRADRPVFIERTRPAPYVQRAVVAGGRKLYYVDVDSAFEGDLEERERRTQVRAGTMLFDLEQDPAETTDLFDEADPHSKELLELLAEHLQREALQGDELEVDEELRQKLRSLGYLE
jgi:arylsulfatase A-like enzyme